MKAVLARAVAGGLLLSLAACAGGGWHGAVQCAPYAREITHVQLSGDAASWWGQARGRYPRGSAPAPGAVLVFRSTGRLPAGHVSVVRAVRGPREVLVDQANWVPGRIGHGEPVVDVSGRNDWSRVKVWWSPIHDMGKTVYPAYGFILPTG